MMAKPALFVALVATLLGCGGLQVDRLSLSDPRLPVDARRWVADAEDAVVVSRARRNAAQAELKAAQRWQANVLNGARLKGPKGATLQGHRDLMAVSRVSAIDAEVALRTAEFELSKSRLQLIYAETAMRHDIAVYDMPPLQAAVDTRLETVIRLREQHRQSRQRALKTADTWWTGWREYSSEKNDTRPFWTTRQ